MITGNIAHLGSRHHYPAKIYHWLYYISQLDLAEMDLGRYELDDNGTYMILMDISPSSLAERPSEVHAKYIDIQLSLDGGESFGFAPDDGSNLVVDDKLEAEDYCLFKGLRNEKVVESISGDFFVFFPEDVHRAAFASKNGKGSVRRLVVKVPEASL